jgi:hypothetical protein
MAQEGGNVLDTGPISVLCDAGSSIAEGQEGGTRGKHRQVMERTLTPVFRRENA